MPGSLLFSCALAKAGNNGSSSTNWPVPRSRAGQHWSNVLPAQHPRVLACDANGVLPLLRESGIVDDQATTPIEVHSGCDPLADSVQYLSVRPLGLGREVMQCVLPGAGAKRVDSVKPSALVSVVAAPASSQCISLSAFRNGLNSPVLETSGPRTCQTVRLHSSFLA